MGNIILFKCLNYDKSIKAITKAVCIIPEETNITRGPAVLDPFSINHIMFYLSVVLAAEGQ